MIEYANDEIKIIFFIIPQLENIRSYNFRSLQSTLPCELKKSIRAVKSSRAVYIYASAKRELRAKKNAKHEYAARKNMP